jgi:CubicO group peptidase (beta-lactamase class C family)
MQRRHRLVVGLCNTFIALCGVLSASIAAAADDPLPRARPSEVGFSDVGLNRIDRFFADEISKDAGRDGYGFGLGVAVRTEPGIAATNGSVGDYSWNGANGTVFWVDPKEKLVVVMMSVGPGEIRKYYREQMSALVYGAMEK